MLCRGQSRHRLACSLRGMRSLSLSLALSLTRTHTHARTHTHTHTHIHTHTHTHTVVPGTVAASSGVLTPGDEVNPPHILSLSLSLARTHIYIYIYTHTHTHKLTSARAHTHTHTHSYTHAALWRRRVGSPRGMSCPPCGFFERYVAKFAPPDAIKLIA